MNGDLFMIEGIDIKSRIMILANYVFDKRIQYQATIGEINIYKNVFHQALEENIFLFVEYDEKEDLIINRS